MKNSEQNQTWDVFISYASEDREAIATPLASLLSKLGVKVWFDQIELKIGDSLRRKIDEGLSHCRFGIVILSPNFLTKEYPNRELDGLAQRELNGKKIILPVWYNIEVEQIRNYSAPLADRIAAKWSDGIHIVASQLLLVIRPDIYKNISKEYKVKSLNEITNGNDLGKFVHGAGSSILIHSELKTQKEIDLIGSFLEEIKDWIDIWVDIGTKGHAEAMLSFSVQINDIKQAGWSIWCDLVDHKYRFKNSLNDKDDSLIIPTLIVAVVRGNPKKVVRKRDGIYVVN